MTETRLAFLTVVKQEKSGEKIGGLLVTNRHGRPIEFHCTEPVIPNRAQQILYGATLDSFICGDCIAPALIDQLKHPADLIITDVKEALGARHHGHIPMAVISKGSSAKGGGMTSSDQKRHRHLVCHPDFANDATLAETLVASVDRWIDLDEPLERIRVAIDEARRTAA